MTQVTLQIRSNHVPRLAPGEETKKYVSVSSATRRKRLNCRKRFLISRTSENSAAHQKSRRDESIRNGSQVPGAEIGSVRRKVRKINVEQYEREHYLREIQETLRVQALHFRRRVEEQAHQQWCRPRIQKDIDDGKTQRGLMADISDVGSEDLPDAPESDAGPD